MTDVSAPDGLLLHVACDRRLWTFSGTEPVVIGSGARNGVRLRGPRVLPEHLRVSRANGGWLVEDLSGGETTELRPGIQLRLRLGSRDGPEVLLGCTASTDVARPRSILIGRSPECDVTTNDPLVSRRHAVVHVGATATSLVDLDSFNGTYLNGQRIERTAELQEGDLVAVGGTLLTWTGGTLAPVTRRPTLSARHLHVRTKEGVQLLDDVSITVPAGQVLAVIGPSGAGKSTLLGALTGLRPATAGSVTWNGQDLYAEYDRLRLLIGLVPQEDILHTQLTVRRGLRFAADLRLPPDTSPEERDGRIAQVLEQVELPDQVDQRIDSLSGGQRKRTSIALELLTTPQLLFLDEPTSGLDAGLDRRVMQRLRQLADAGRVIVVVTHSVLALDQCDRVLLMAPGGRVAFFGPPTELLGFFGVADYPSVFLALQDETWSERYARSTARRAYLGRTGVMDMPVLIDDRRPPPSVPRRTRQLWTLVKRNVAVVTADRGFLLLLVAMPLLMAAMARALPGEYGVATPLTREAADEAQQRLLVLIVGAALMGTAMSVRDLVRERAIFRREHAVGLSTMAYLVSKILVLGSLVAGQAAVLTVLSLVGLPAPDNPRVFPSGLLEIVVAIVALAVTMTVAGLTVSAAVRSSEQSMPALVALVMAQLVFCGALFPLADRAVLEQVAWLLPGRFSFAATASTVGLQRLSESGKDPLWDPTAAQWLLDIGLLGVQAMALVVLAIWFLERSVVERRGGAAV